MTCIKISKVFLHILFILLCIFIVLAACSSYILYQERYIPPDAVIEPDGWYDYPGNIHFHTVYSDGSGQFNDVIQAAHDIGLSYILSADHNTIQPFLNGVEAWRNGVLVLNGVEISSSVGHLIYYDAGGLFDDYDPAAVEDLLREKRSCIDTILFLAHPFHPRMPFKHWSYPGFYGMELFNGDVQWRDDSFFELLTAVVGSIFLPDAQNHLVDYPSENMRKWDELLKDRPMVGIGSSDAHSRIKVTKRWNIAFPSYTSSFNFVKTHILTREPFKGDLESDRLLVIRSLRKGAAYIELGNFCDPTGFLFTAQIDSGIVLPGDTVSLEDSVRLIIQIPDSTDVLIRLIKDGEIAAEGINMMAMEYETCEPGVYRAEIFQIRKGFPNFPLRRIPWIISNPIFITDYETF